MLRRPLALALLLCAAACGPAASPPPAATASASPYREQIPDEITNRARGATLKDRDTPLPVGSPAPAFQGRPAGNVVLVFYRGHW